MLFACLLTAGRHPEKSSAASRKAELSTLTPGLPVVELEYMSAQILPLHAGRVLQWRHCQALPARARLNMSNMLCPAGCRPE